MKQFLLVFFIPVALVVNAQSFSFTPGKVFTQNLGYNDYSFDGIYINNLTSSTLNLSWELLSMDTVPGCFFNSCASGTCYFGIPSTGNFPALLPSSNGDSLGWYQVHSFTGTTSGSNTIKMRVYNKDNTSESDTITFIMNVSNTNGLNQYSNAHLINVYPNPSSDYINISGAVNQYYYLHIYNILGQKMLDTIYSSGSDPISIKNFEAGNYYIILEGQKGIRYTGKIQKTTN
jgi:hypothetical protein